MYPVFNITARKGVIRIKAMLQDSTFMLRYWKAYLVCKYVRITGIVIRIVITHGDMYTLTRKCQLLQYYSIKVVCCFKLLHYFAYIGKVCKHTRAYFPS
jgi:hypothetical protein